MTQSNNIETKKSKRPWTTAARILMGLVFFVFGLIGLLHLNPPPKGLPEGAMAFFEALMKTGYMMPLVSATQTLAGAMLLLNRFVPLALAFLAPVIVNIILFHIFLAPSGLPVACVVLVLELFLAWSYRRTFAPMLAFRA